MTQLDMIENDLKIQIQDFFPCYIPAKLVLSLKVNSSTIGTAIEQKDMTKTSTHLR